MKNIKTLLMMIILIVVSSYQSNSQTYDKMVETSTDINILEKHNGSLRYYGSNQKLDNAELMKILDTESYELYEKSHKQHVASIPFWAITGVGAVSTTAFIGLSVYSYLSYEYDPEMPTDIGLPYLMMAGACTFSLALLSAVPATILTIKSNQKLNTIVGEYNRNLTDVSLNLGATKNGFGLVLKF